jgi:diguanylate cyclase (GGDEF)-like protein
MDVLRPAVTIDAGPRQRTESTDAELARLREQVAWLKAERAALWWAVGHDDLTGLANRRLFSELAPALVRDGRPAVLIILDLNGFKPINDAFGHEAGDLVLQIVAERLASRAGDGLVARLGGDEFSAVLSGPRRESTAHWWYPMVTTLSAAIAEPMRVSGQTLNVTASIGVAPAHDGVTVGELLRRADRAMYHAKVNRRSYTAWADPAEASDAGEPYGRHRAVHDHDQRREVIAAARAARAGMRDWHLELQLGQA